MGIVVIQIGQGGNQMGYKFFDKMSTMGTSIPTIFFRECEQRKNSIARAILIDMDSKVVFATLSQARAHNKRQHWSYSVDRKVVHDSGSGNNWARGFYKYGPRYHDTIIDAIRLEVEACDKLDGFMTMQSLAGGTGAGLGAFIVEALKDEFPSSCTLSHCIWPYNSGEVIVQNYNVLLTLSHLQGLADGMIIVQNEELSSICKNLLSIPRPSFNDMNEVGAQALASIMLPSYWRPVDTDLHSNFEGLCKSKADKQSYPSFGGPQVRILSDLISLLCAHPGYRLLSLRFTPQVPLKSMDFTTFSWGIMLKYLRQMLITGAHAENNLDWKVSIPKSTAFDDSKSRFPADNIRQLDKSIANILVLRGQGSQFAPVGDFAEEKLYPIWSVDPLSVAASTVPFGRYETAAGLLSNCQSTVLPASRVLPQAYRMYSSKAYLYQYFEHGMDQADFDSAFATVEDVTERYLTL